MWDGLLPSSDSTTFLGPRARSSKEPSECAHRFQSSSTRCMPLGAQLWNGPYCFGRLQNYATLPLAHDCCFTLLTLSFAVRVSEPVTPIFVPPVEMPAPCHVRLGETTLKPCESFALCRSRLSLPYVLRSTSLLRQHEKSTQHAKVVIDGFKTGRTELRAVAVIALHHFMS
jgi:hypothetical protein